MTIAETFLARARHYLADEYPAKLRLAVAPLPPDALWWRANDSSNSIGNLLLHLTGNVRQWIVSGVGGAPDTRYRSAEFEARDGASAADLLAVLTATLGAADGVLGRLTPEQLLTRRTIQARDVSVLDAVFHVVEHFGMHTGQIILLAKLHAPGAIRFYEDAGGLARPIWRG